jgi:uncharacterized protein UPF0236
LLGWVLGQEKPDLEALEMAIRDAVHQMGCRWLEKMLNSDQGGYGGPQIEVEPGQAGGFLGYRDKEVVTVVGPVNLQRAYYYCAESRQGRIPKDEALDIVGTHFSPGVRRLMGRVGSKESFEEGRQDLEELAGIRVTTKQVERVAEAIGEQAQASRLPELETRFSQKVVPLKTIATLYVAYDGTGVPVVPRESQGRRGKKAEQAKTREAKVGCVFSQTSVAEKGHPVRDEGSTSYVGAIETAEAFGPRIYREAVRRGLDQAKRVVVLGDGAPWIWKIADEHFPAAVQIVDLYHARQHLAELAKLVYGPTHPKWKPWATARYHQLDSSQVEKVIGAILRLKSLDPKIQLQLDRERNYFQSNAERMRYADFRRQGWFVGSGVVEAGCKTIIGFRLKQSGMQWTVRGANAIIALRCLDLSGRWEEFWENRAVG